MIYPKFLVMRFPFGAAGNFVASCLQCSTGVGHWSPEIEAAKPDVDWLSYFKDVFTPDYDNWITNEPSVRYSLGVNEIYSSFYERGNYLKDIEFTNAELACNQHYFNLKKADKYIPVFWMKAFFPAYYERSVFVDIFLDDASLRWYDRAYYRKHFKVKYADQKYIVLNKHHIPGAAPKSFSGSNQYITHFDTFRAFVNKSIIGNTCKSLFQSADVFDNCSGNRLRHKMFLSDVLNHDNFISQYEKICDLIEVATISRTEISSLHKHWLGCHNF
jgi:hypothetical protein